nr:uncharacterized protein CI109_002267 [Kwoniella shandongensis]KAA5529374.1 hypothetical protein CI109_002267 [Kwoniella shandongensis]
MPSYRLMDWPHKPSKRYDLYLYREQGWDIGDTVSGHPVIFIPGNAGSYQQVRSIASSASHQFHGEPGGQEEDMVDAKKLDFFTGTFGITERKLIDLVPVDLNEEFSAFDARTLREQAKFIQACITRVIQEYDHLDTSDRPQQVTLLAHSMGGIVARLAIDYSTTNLVDVVFTMSTPHLLPPLTLEYGMDDIYRTINVPPKSSNHPLLFSLCGGISDEQVVSDSCALSANVVKPGDGFAAFTTGVPGVWTGVDHQAMVWCHQIRWRVARILLDMTKSDDRGTKLLVAERWLLDNHAYSPKHHDLGYQRTLPLSNPNMTLIGQPGSAVDMRIRQCTQKGECVELSASRRVLPRPTNHEAPFPLPGEGIKPDEAMFAIDIATTKSSDTLSIETGASDWLTIGESKTYVVGGNTWSESVASDFADEQDDMQTMHSFLM